MVNPVSIKKILVPVDGSETSFKAANYAIHFAKLVNAELIPVNIVEDVKQGGAIGLQAKYGNVSIVKAFKKARKLSAEGWLKKIENSAEKLGVQAKSVILDAEGKNEKKMVTEYAVKNNIDIIIIEYCIVFTCNISSVIAIDEEVFVDLILNSCTGLTEISAI